MKPTAINTMRLSKALTKTSATVMREFFKILKILVMGSSFLLHYFSIDVRREQDEHGSGCQRSRRGHCHSRSGRANGYHHCQRPQYPTKTILCPNHRLIPLSADIALLAPKSWVTSTPPPIGWLR